MDNKFVITIGRQFGSCGKEIGQELAKRFGITFYDKELISLASKESGLCQEFFEKADEKNSGNLLQALPPDLPSGLSSTMIFFLTISFFKSSRM